MGTIIKRILTGGAGVLAVAVLTPASAMAASSFSDHLWRFVSADGTTTANVIDFSKGSSRIFDAGNLTLTTDDTIYLDAPGVVFLNNALSANSVTTRGGATITQNLAVGGNATVAGTLGVTGAITGPSVQTSTASGQLLLQPNADSSGRVRLFRNTTGNPLFNIWGYDSSDLTQKPITIGVFDNAGYTEAGSTSRAIITAGGNVEGERMALELQSPDQVRITAVDGVLNQGKVRIAADTTIEMHAAVSGGEASNLIATVSGTGLTLASGKNINGAAMNINTDAGSNTTTIGGGSTAGTVFIGTGATAKTVTIGTVAGAAAINLLSGSGGVNVTGALNAGSGDFTGTLRTIGDNSSSFRLRGASDLTGDGVADSTSQTYAGIFYNATYDDTGGTGAKTTRAIWGSNEDMDLEFQGSNHIRISATDGTTGNGRIRLAAEDEIQMHAGASSETDALVATVTGTGLTLASGKNLTVTGAVDFSGASSLRVPAFGGDLVDGGTACSPIGKITYDTDGQFFGCSGALWQQLDN